MGFKLLRHFAFLVLFTNLYAAYGEGTKQLQPTESQNLKLYLLDSLGTKFASYQASVDERLHIHIKDPGKETIYFGFGLVFTSPSQVPASADPDLVIYYRIRNPLGEIVYGGTVLPDSPRKLPVPGEPGFISTYEQAVTGPAQVAGVSGYNAINYQPLLSGDYYIEFNADDPVVFNQKGFKINFFDISVVDKTTNQVKNGRLWAKVWDLISIGADFPDTKISSSFYIYTPDGVVSKVNYNNIQPFGFNLYANSTSGFKSARSRVISPEHKIFLCQPDHEVYPSGQMESISSVTTAGCEATGYKINVTATTAALADIYFELNGQPDFQTGTADVKISANLTAGLTEILWNGKDGLGIMVPAGTHISGLVKVQAGLINLGIHDAEQNLNGFIVTLQRPYNNIHPKVYYDDREIDNVTVNSTGCTNPVGCHTWPQLTGNLNTLVTSWYTQEIEKTFSFQTAPCVASVPQLNVTKAANIPQLQPDGSYTVTFTISVENQGTLPLGNVQVIDDLALAFPVPVTFSLVSAPTATGSLVANTTFQGHISTNPNGVELLTAGSTLVAGATETITFSVNFNIPDVTRSYENIAIASATDPLDAPITDTAKAPVTFPPNAVIGVAKVASEPVRQDNGSYDVTYSFTVKNLGNAPLHEVQVLENLEAAFPAPTTFTVKGPVATTGTLYANVNFDGVTQVSLLNSTKSTLPVGATEKISFRVNITLHRSEDTTFYNSAVGFGLAPDNTPAVDTSHVGTNPDPNGNGNPNEVGESVPTPVTIKELFIPEGYSPNGDQSHDTFVIWGVSHLVVNLEIFNRWGNLVYKKANYQNDWDGRSNVGLRIGDELPDGTYYYVVRLSDGRKFVNYLTLAR